VGLRDRRALLCPKEQAIPTEAEKARSLDRNPRGRRCVRLWSDSAFLENVRGLNARRSTPSSPTYHATAGTSWLSTTRDGKANLLDGDGKVVSFDDRKKFTKAVHLQDIHLEKGMHWSTCHFARMSTATASSTAKYGNTIEIECQDCHGSVSRLHDPAHLRPRRTPGRNDLLLGTTPFFFFFFFFFFFSTAPLHLVTIASGSARW